MTYGSGDWAVLVHMKNTNNCTMVHYVTTHTTHSIVLTINTMMCMLSTIDHRSIDITEYTTSHQGEIMLYPTYAKYITRS